MTNNDGSTGQGGGRIIPSKTPKIHTNMITAFSLHNIKSLDDSQIENSIKLGPVLRSYIPVNSKASLRALESSRSNVRTVSSNIPLRYCGTAINHYHQKIIYTDKVYEIYSQSSMPSPPLAEAQLNNLIPVTMSESSVNCFFLSSLFIDMKAPNSV